MFLPPPPPDPAMINVAPASYVYGDALLRAAIKVADARNTRVGHGPPPCDGGADVYVYDDAPGNVTVARGEYNGCRVYFSREFRNDIWTRYTDPEDLGYLSDRRRAAADACKTSTHERLHNLGFDHMPTGIMAEQDEDQPVPSDCWRWAKRLLPNVKRSARNPA